MKYNLILTLAITLLFLLPRPGFAQKHIEPVKIIFDSDMGPDFDDVGAITILHALAAKGECEILATMASDGYPYIGPTLEVFNRYFQKPNIPIGVPGADAPAFSCPNHWNLSLIHISEPTRRTPISYAVF